MKELEADIIFIEADQIIYTKVLDVMFALKNKGKNLFPIIILYKVGFRHEYAAHNLQFIQKIWYSTAPFFRAGLVDWVL